MPIFILYIFITASSKDGYPHPLASASDDIMISYTPPRFRLGIIYVSLTILRFWCYVTIAPTQCTVTGPRNSTQRPYL